MYWENSERVIVESDSAKKLYRSLIYDRRSHFYNLAVPEYRLHLGSTKYTIPGVHSPLADLLEYENVSVGLYFICLKIKAQTLNDIMQVLEQKPAGYWPKNLHDIGPSVGPQ